MPSVLSFIETCARDLRHGMRAILHSPSFSLVVILTLALVIFLSTLAALLPLWRATQIDAVQKLDHS